MRSVPRLALPAAWLLAALAAHGACGGDLAPGGAGASIEDGGDARGASHPSRCADLVPDGSSACILCEGYWYCPANPPYVACPDGDAGPGDGTGGACDYDGSCFACNLDGVAGSTCACDRGDSDAGGPGDGPLAWDCMPSGFGCSR